MSKPDSRIYVGNLPQDIRTKDVEDIFYKYGKIKYVDLKNRKGPPFAFVEFDDPRDARDAVESRDGYQYDGHRLRVEFQKGPRGGGGMSRGGSGRGGPPTRRSENRCIITGLPPSGSWQDLKDHMREAGNVCYADVFKDGTGVVEFIRYDDMKYAIKNLDDTKFRSHEGHTGYIRVKADTSRMDRSVSRSRSRSRSLSARRNRRLDDRERASPSYSPVKHRYSSDDSYDDHRSKNGHRKRSKRSRSRSRSPRYSRSRSRSSRSVSRSRSRSRSLSSERDKDKDRSRRHNGTKKLKADEKEHSKSKSKSRSRSRSRSVNCDRAESAEKEQKTNEEEKEATDEKLNDLEPKEKEETEKVNGEEEEEAKENNGPNEKNAEETQSKELDLNVNDELNGN